MGNINSIKSMQKANAGMVAAFRVDLGMMVKMTIEEYQEKKKEGMAFHINHPVTKMFKENVNLKQQLAAMSEGVCS
jgi:hypothetical protein